MPYTTSICRSMSSSGAIAAIHCKVRFARKCAARTLEEGTGPLKPVAAGSQIGAMTAWEQSFGKRLLA